MLAAILAFWALYRWFKKQEILYQTNWKIKLSDLEFQNGQTKKRNRQIKSSRDKTPDILAVGEIQSQNDDSFSAPTETNVAHGLECPLNAIIDSGAGGDSYCLSSNKNKQSDSESVGDTAYSSMDESPSPEVNLDHTTPEVTLIESLTKVIPFTTSTALSKHDGFSTKHKSSPPKDKSTGRWSKEDLCEGRIAFDQFSTSLARYKGSLVSVRRVNKKRVKTNVDLWYEMADVMDIGHPNLAVFVGACAKKPTVFTVWEYCERASLTDVIKNRELQGGPMLQFSIALDVSRGLAYLHKSAIGAHGNLKANNVVIDNKWVAKITDFGLHRFKDGEIRRNWPDGDDAHLKDMDWTPPESIRSILNDETPKQNKKGDVYALGIIYKQIICRNEPYSEVQDMYSPEDIITKIGADPTEDFRPLLPEEFPENQSAMAAWVRLTQKCWDDTPTERPTAKEALKKLAKVCPFKASDIRGQASTVMTRYSLYVCDQLKHRMSQPADSTDIDSKLTEKVDNEHPGPTADHDKNNDINASYSRDTNNEDNDAEQKSAINDKGRDTSNSVTIPPVRVFHQERPPMLRVIQSASVLVCNIVDFKTLACYHTPAEMLSLLNSVCQHISDVASQHKMLTVETASGGYVAFSGCTDHAGVTSQAALACRDIVEAAGITMQVRIGVGSGPVAIATVGRMSPRMCVVGGGVMSAVNMEATGLPQKIHVCEKTNALLSGNPCYCLESHGSGPGQTPSFWMVGLSI